MRFYNTGPEMISRVTDIYGRISGVSEQVLTAGQDYSVSWENGQWVYTLHGVIQDGEVFRWEE